MELFIIRFTPRGAVKEEKYYVAAHSADQAFHLLSGRLKDFRADQARWEVSRRYDLSNLHEPRVLAGKRSLRLL